MGYVVPDWKKSIDQNKFDVTVGDQTFRLVKAEYMTGDEVEKLQAASDSPIALYGVLDDMCPGLGAAFRPVPMKYLLEFVQAWQNESGIELGESLASSGSSVSTERPSNTTA